jgi:hypothetical protein
MTLRKRIFAAAAALALSATPSFAAGHPAGGGHAGGGHTGGGHTGGGHYSGGNHYSGGGYRGGYSGGGVALGLGLGLSLGGGGYYGGGGYAGYGGYGGSIYRPSYYGNGYSGGGYYGNGVQPNYYSPGVVVAPPTVYTYPNVVNNPTTVAPPEATIPLGVATGLKITDLYDGTAKTAGLRKGDIILKVDGTRTQSFEELRATLSTGKDKVLVEYIDGTSGETDKRTIPVDGTKIGVSVSETPIAK